MPCVCLRACVLLSALTCTLQIFFLFLVCLRVYASAGHVCRTGSRGVPHTDTHTHRPTSAASDGNNWDLPRLFGSLESACRRASSSRRAFARLPFFNVICVFFISARIGLIGGDPSFEDHLRLRSLPPQASAAGEVQAGVLDRVMRKGRKMNKRLPRKER